MSKLLLKAVPFKAASTDMRLSEIQSIGYIDTLGSTKRLIVKAKPKTIYMLVDAQTGQIIKHQHVLRYGRSIQVQVDSMVALVLEDFFSSNSPLYQDTNDSAGYVVDTSAEAVPTYGLVNAHTPITVSDNGMLVLWSSGINQLPLIDPMAYGAPLLAAMAATPTPVVAVLVAAAGVGVLNDSTQAPASEHLSAKTSSSAMLKVGVFMGPVTGKLEAGAGLKVQVFDPQGNKLAETLTATDGSYTLSLGNDPANTGVLVIKVSPGVGAGAKYLDEATGLEKDFTTPLLALLNYQRTEAVQTVNVTPLTHIAALKAGLIVTADGIGVAAVVPSAQDMANANTQVAQWFKLPVSELSTAAVVTSEKATVNAYGRVLALLSQLEASNGKTTAEVMDIITQAVSGDPTAYNLLMQALNEDIKDGTVSIPNVSNDELQSLTVLASAAPRFISANTSMDGTRIYVHFDAVLSLNTASAKAFTVSVKASASEQAAVFNPIQVDVDGQDLVLTLDSAVKQGQTLALAYKDPSDNNDVLAVQNLEGIDVASFNASLSEGNYAGKPVPVLTIKPDQSFSYAENHNAATLGTVVLLAGQTDVKKFRFADSLTAQSSDGFFQIDTDGHISLTTAGQNRRNASNDYETSPNSFNLSVQAGDDAGHWSAAVSVLLAVTDDIQEAPFVTAPRIFNLTEDTPGQLVFGHNAFSATGNPLLTVTLSVDDGVIQAAPAAGVAVAGSDTARIFTGTADALNTFFSTPGKINYTSAQDVNGKRLLTVTVSEAGFSSSSISRLQITAVNDAPLATGRAFLPAIFEDNTSAAGSTVSFLFANNFSDSKDKVEKGSSLNTFIGVAITGNAATTAQGVWEWQAKDSATWTAVSQAVADSKAFYLAADSQLRFVPAKDYNGEPGALSARLVESAAAGLSNGTTLDVSRNGGSSAYSADTVDLQTRINAKNDAPVNTVTNSAFSVEANITTYVLNGPPGPPQGHTSSVAVTGLSIADVDAGDGRMSVTLSVAHGSLAHNSGDGVTFLATDTGFQASGSLRQLNAWLASSDAVLYTPATGYAGDDALTMLTSDGGNTGTGGEQTDSDTVVLHVHDTRAPVLLKVQTDVRDGRLIYLTYDEALDSAYTAFASAYTLSVYEQNDLIAVKVQQVFVSGRVVTLTLDTPLQIHQTASLTYSLAGTASGNAVKDANGVPAASFVEHAVRIVVPDLVKPVVEDQQSLSYFENIAEASVVGKVNASDNVDVTGYRFVAVDGNSGNSTSPDEYFAIDSDGNIHITATGVAVGLNNYENTLGALRTAQTTFSYSIQARDEYGNWSDPKTVQLNLQNMNEAPTLTRVNTLSGLLEDSVNEISYAQLLAASDAADVDVSHGDTIAFLITGVSSGTLKKWQSGEWVAITVNSTTLAVGEKLQWQAESHANGDALHAFTVKAVDAQGLTSDKSLQVTAKVTAVNDAPVVIGAVNHVLPDAVEDITDAANTGQTVQQLFGSNFSDSTDNVAGGSAPNSFLGVAITSNASLALQGVWQYSDDGSHWSNIAVNGNPNAPSATNAVFVKANAYLRFLPALNFNGMPGQLTAHLVDALDSPGNIASGFTAALSSMSASVASVTLGIAVTPVNDAPQASGRPALASIDEGTVDPSGRLISELFAGNFNDGLDKVTSAVSGGSAANRLAGIAVIANTADANSQGVWQWRSADLGSEWTSISTLTSAAHAVFLRCDALLRFVPFENFNGSPTALSVKLVDDSDAATAALSNASWLNTSTANDTRFSMASLDVGININPVNNAPKNTLPAAATVIEANMARFDVNGARLAYTAQAITGLGVSDVDAGDSPLSLTLSVNSGTLRHADSATGVDFSANDASSFTASGSQTNLNAWLRASGALVYTPATGVVGDAILTMATSDGGASGSPGPQTVTANVTLTVNDTRAPVLLKAETSAGGDFIYLSYDEALDARTAVDASQYALNIVTNRGDAVNSIAVSSVSVSDRVVTLAMNQNLLTQHVITLNYSATAPGASRKVHDTNGVDAVSLNTVAVTNKVPDTESPTIVANQSFDYFENQSANAVLGTVQADDNKIVSGFRFTASNSSTSLDGYFSIASDGKISMTASGVNAYVNNFENTAGANRAAQTRLYYSIQATDGPNWSSPIDVSFTLKNANDPPTLSVSTNPKTFTEGVVVRAQGQPVSGLFTGAVFADVENHNIASLTLTVSNVRDGASELLLVDTKTIPLGSASTVTSLLNGSVSGLSYTSFWSASSKLATVVLSKSGGLSYAEARTVLESIGYQNTNIDNPTAAARDITLTKVVDTGSGNSPDNNTANYSFKATVTVTAYNDPPSLTATPVNNTFTEGPADTPQADPVQGLFTGAAFSDLENNSMASVNVTVSNVLEPGKDVLWVDGKPVALGANVSSTTSLASANGVAYRQLWTASTKTSVVIISKVGGNFNANEAKSLVESLGYQNTNTDNPAAGERVISITRVSDNGTGTATPNNFNYTDYAVNSSLTAKVNVVPVNDAPRLTATALNPVFTKGDGALPVPAPVKPFSGAVISTVETADTLTGLTLTVSGVVDGAQESIMLAGTTISLGLASNGTTTDNGMTYAVNLADGLATVTLTKTPGVSSALAQDLVNGISYLNANTATPGPAGSRVFTLSQLKDSGGTSNNGADTSTLSLVSTVTVLAANHAPVGNLLVSGNAQVNSYVYADLSQVTDADGLGDGVNYQWQSADAGSSTWTDLATTAVYRLTAGDLGKQIRVNASYTDAGGHAELLSASAVTVAADSTPPAFKQLSLLAQGVRLEFNETLDSSQALNMANLSLLHDGQALTPLDIAIGTEATNTAHAVNITLDSSQWNATGVFEFAYTAPTNTSQAGQLSDVHANHASSFHVFVYRGDTANNAGHTEGNDFIMGGAGNDTLTGGKGNDVMWGLDSLGTAAASDSDTFVWALGDAGDSEATDVVKDFTPYNNGTGDKLDISGLLQGYNSPNALLSDWVKTVATAQVVNGVANCTVISIDVDGSGLGTSTQTIVLENVNLLSGLNGTLEQQLQALKTSGVIVA